MGCGSSIDNSETTMPGGKAKVAPATSDTKPGGGGGGLILPAVTGADEAVGGGQGRPASPAASTSAIHVKEKSSTTSGQSELPDQHPSSTPKPRQPSHPGQKQGFKAAEEKKNKDSLQPTRGAGPVPGGSSTATPARTRRSPDKKKPEAQNKSFEDEIQQLKLAATKKDQEIKDLKAAVADAKKKEKKLDTELNPIRAKANKADQLQVNLKHQKKELEQVKKDLQQQVAKTKSPPENAAKTNQLEGEIKRLKAQIARLQDQAKTTEDATKEKQKKLEDRNKELNKELTGLRQQAETVNKEEHNADKVQALLQAEVIKTSGLEDEQKQWKAREKGLVEERTQWKRTEQELMKEKNELQQQFTDMETALLREKNEHQQKITDLETAMEGEKQKKKEQTSKQNAELKQLQEKVERMDKDYNSLLEARISQDPNNQNLNDKWRVARVMDLNKELRDNKRLDFLDDLEKKGYKEEHPKLPLLRIPSIVLMECFEQAETTVATVFEEVKGAVKKVLKPQTQVKSLDRVFTELKVLLKSHMADLNPQAFDKHVTKKLEPKLKEGKGAYKFLTTSETGKLFMAECIQLGSAMAVQHPAMFPVTSDSTKPIPGDKDYDHTRHNLFSECKAADRKIAYFVWPTLVGSTGLDVLEKGVVFTTK